MRDLGVLELTELLCRARAGDPRRVEPARGVFMYREISSTTVRWLVDRDGLIVETQAFSRGDGGAFLRGQSSDAEMRIGDGSRTVCRVGCRGSVAPFLGPE